MLTKFSSTGSSDREQTCEAFELLLRTFHQSLLLKQSPLSLEIGVIDGEVVQAFRTHDTHARRAVKTGLKNAFAGCQLSNLPDHAYVPQGETSVYFADVELKNDLYSIKRWPELLTESDPLTALLGSLAVNNHAKFFSHVVVMVVPLTETEHKRHRDCFLSLQSPFFQRHDWIAIGFERVARSSKPLVRGLGWAMRRTARRPKLAEPTITVGSSRHHERETDVQSASNKLNSACFATTIRIRVYGPPNQINLATEIINQVFAPLAQYNAPRLGQFRLGKVQVKPSRNRKFFLLSCPELASIFHPPVVTTERLATNRLVQLESPKDLPIASKDARIMNLGQTHFHDLRQRFGLFDKDAGLHGFVVGSSGSGKTTLLTTAIDSLIKRGQGITLVDFHGDFAKSILNRVPKQFRSKVVEFSPLSDKPIAFNPLACPEHERWPLVADSVLAAMKNLFGDSWGPRLEQILFNALSAAIASGNSNFQDVRRMLVDESARMKILANVRDPVVREFWLGTFTSWGKRLQIEAVQSVINKLDALLTPKLRAILCQSGSSFDFRTAFDQQKIVVVNLARGQMGQTAASTLGSFVLSAIQNAALSRADMPEDERLPHTVFLDELQLYSNPQALTSLLSEARKYRVAVWSATQSLASIDRDEVLPIVLANAANFISFRVSQKDAVEIAPMLDDKVTPRDIVSLPRFHAYARVMINGEVQSPFSLQTTR